MKKEIQEAYRTVLRDLNKSYDNCKEYEFGCYSCQIQRLAQDLEDVFELHKESP